MFFVPVIFSIFFKGSKLAHIFGPMLTALFVMTPSSFAKATPSVEKNLEYHLKNNPTVTNLPFTTEIDNSSKRNITSSEEPESLASQLEKSHKILDSLSSQFLGAQFNEYDLPPSEQSQPTPTAVTSAQIKQLRELSQSYLTIFDQWKKCALQENYEEQLSSIGTSPLDDQDQENRTRYYSTIHSELSAQAILAAIQAPKEETSQESLPLDDFAHHLHKTQEIFQTLKIGLTLLNCSN